jgi:DnaJ-domain-containing protein 1
MARYAELTTALSWSELSRRLRDNFRKWGIAEYMVPTLKAAESVGGAVTVEFMWHGKWKSVPCGQWNSDRDHKAPYRNFHALVLAFESVRLAEQRGIAGIFAEVAQYFALPEAGDSSPYRVLGVERGASDEQIRAAYRRRVMETHPDRGGAAKEFAKVIEAGKTLGVA